MMRLGRITMECAWCKKTLEVDRWTGDPITAVRLSLQCTDCDDGDFHHPLFYDAAGDQVFERDPEKLPIESRERCRPTRL